MMQSDPNQTLDNHMTTTKTRVLAVMDSATDGGTCEELKKNYDLHCTQTLRPTLRQISEFDPELIVIDLDANTPGKARRVTQAARTHYLRPFILLIKSGRSAPRDLSYYDAILSRPFVFEQLTAAIDDLLKSRSEYVISNPPFTLDRRTQVLAAPKGKVRLNPKLSRLMEVFLLHPGQVITPMALMKEVWKMSLFGDIRTLYVHIHWLREIIEDNPAHPKYLKTVARNRGYFIDLQGPVNVGGEPLYVRT